MISEKFSMAESIISLFLTGMRHQLISNYMGNKPQDPVRWIDRANWFMTSLPSTPKTQLLDKSVVHSTPKTLYSSKGMI